MIQECLEDNLKSHYRLSAQVGFVFHGQKSKVPDGSTFTCKSCKHDLNSGDLFIRTYENYLPSYHLDCYQGITERILDTYKELGYELLNKEVDEND
jgi:hypothetical protein